MLLTSFYVGDFKCGYQHLQSVTNIPKCLQHMSSPTCISNINIASLQLPIMVARTGPNIGGPGNYGPDRTSKMSSRDLASSLAEYSVSSKSSSVSVFCPGSHISVSFRLPRMRQIYNVDTEIFFPFLQSHQLS